MRIGEVEFVKSATQASEWPRDRVREVAFVGRSNVGKSNLINRLTNRKGLARVSSTPGRTRLLNFFDVEVVPGETAKRIRFCDLPGYGFAKVSKSERGQWAKMIEEYLEEREELEGVVVILDARHGPTADDLQMFGWMEAKGRRAIAVATKLDKLPKAKRIPAIAKIAKGLGLPVVGFSSEDGTGREELWRALLAGDDQSPS